jgi:hypothetical protein
LGHKETSKEDEQNKRQLLEGRLLAPDGERALLAEIRSILGEAEMQKNGGMWRMRIRRGAHERRALRNTIEDYIVRTPEQRAGIRHLPKWFTDRYQRNLLASRGKSPASFPRGMAG